MTSLKVVVSGAAGQICYSLLPLLCSGSIFGDKVRLDLRLLDIPMALSALEGVGMELQDSGFTLLDQVIRTSELSVAFDQVDVAILVGGFPRKQGMLRKDLIEKNAAIFQAQGQALEQFASKQVKVLVVANPANTNCAIALSQAPSLNASNFTALTRLDHERLRGFIVQAVQAKSKISSINTQDIRHCIIWGNHSATQVPDVRHAEIQTAQGWAPIHEVIPDPQWLFKDLICQVQTRGAAVIAARKLSSAMSAAAAIAKHMRDWAQGSEEASLSMGVWTTEADQTQYNIPAGLVYSIPIKCTGQWQLERVVYSTDADHGKAEINAQFQQLMDTTAQELKEEYHEAMEAIARGKL